jgi:hypothetical protein
MLVASCCTTMIPKLRDYLRPKFGTLRPEFLSLFFIKKTKNENAFSLYNHYD